MLDPEHYEGREQTYVKHFVLEMYLERVAYNIYSFRQDFVYVDGFSGPWKSANESYEDTSFKIAIDVLRKVRDGLWNTHGKRVDFRCLFIEKHTKPYSELKAAVEKIGDVQLKLIHGAFEDHVSDIYDFAQRSFSLIFIDPTGWHGFPMEKISPLLNLRGEVLINFMSDFINRFIEDSRPEIAATFDTLFGGEWYSGWKSLTEQGLSREAAAIDFYTTRLKDAGNFKYVTSTRILKPTADRSYFYLIYATQHWKGIQEFRRVERRAVEMQERVRNAAKYRSEVSRKGMDSLFGVQFMDAAISSFEEEKDVQLKRGHAKLVEILKAHPSGLKYEELLGMTLQTPLVWESNLKDWIADLRDRGKVDIPDLKPPQRVARIGQTLIPTELL